MGGTDKVRNPKHTKDRGQRTGVPVNSPSHTVGPCFAKLVFGIVPKRPTNTCTPTGSSISSNMKKHARMLTSGSQFQKKA